MTRLLTFIAGLALMTCVVGCCYRPGYYDPVTGMAYGGYWEPCCGGPFCMWSCGAGWGCGYGGWGAGSGWTGTGSCGCGGWVGSTVVSPSYPTPEVVGAVEGYPSETVYDNGWSSGSHHHHSHGTPSQPSHVVPYEEWQPSETIQTPPPAPPAEEDSTSHTLPPDAYYPSSRVAPPSRRPTIRQTQPNKWVPARF